jgi:phospholipase/carboxylesterase
VVVVAAVLEGGCSRRPPLQTIVHGGEGPPTLVLLHGYGSSAEEWAPFTKTIQWPSRGRFVFPQGPEVLSGSSASVARRAWWPLDLRSNIPAGQSLPDLSSTRPAGLRIAADRVEDLLRSLTRTSGAPVVLGGFSQGAMVASEVAFRSDVPLTGLVLLSGTAVDEASWRAGYKRRRGLPVFIAHGRRDGTLPIAISDRMRQDLQAAGLDVTWLSFDGGHDIPAEAVIALNTFLRRFAVEQ